jgi:nucleoside-diphosphate-sugar epimerase
VAATALITGATGLIGRHVLRHWDLSDLQPVVVDHRVDDLLVQGVPTTCISKHRPAVVVHLAWVASGTEGYRASADNDRWVESTLELALACRDVGAALVATGTAVDGLELTADPYSTAKGRLRRALGPAIDSGAMTWIRPFYVVDPARRRPRVVEQALAAAEAGSTVVLNTPSSRHDFVHASDVGRAVVLSVRHGMRGDVPIGSGTLRRVCDLVTALGVRWTPGPDPALPSAQHHEAADIERFRALGWAPTCTEELFGRE